VVVDVVPAVLGVLASFPVVLDGSVLAFLSLCWPFVVVVAFEQKSRHQQARDSEEDSLLVPD
jgi:predicted tellurium resistance membrane protein TerC